VVIPGVQPEDKFDAAYEGDLKGMFKTDEQAKKTGIYDAAKHHQQYQEFLQSPHYKAKDASKHSDDGTPLHSFRTLLRDLGTVAYNLTSTSLNPNAKIAITTRPTPLQAKAFKLLNVNPVCSQ
jgi:hypothetical protein